MQNDMICMRNFIAMFLGLFTFAPQLLAQLPRDYSGNCTDAKCHGSYLKPAFVHSPVEGGSCDACHEPEDGKAHQFRFVEEGAVLCFECHEEFEGKVVHEPVKSGDCTSCHDPHASANRALLVEPTVREVCEQCHDELTEEMDFLHGPVAAGACESCHSPHASNHEQLLVSSERSLCLNCHQDLQETLQSNSKKHDPVSEGCTVCHNPHGGETNKFTVSPPMELCIECHEDIGEIIEDASCRHDVVSSGRKCVSCHDPHGSNFEKILLQEPKALCLSCHNREIKSGDTMIADIAGELKSHRNHHGPIAQGSCTECHQAHGSENARLLADVYPARFYAAFDEDQYAFCFGCHDSELVESAECEEETEFRNGKQNLHHLHVNRAKGRTCRACHSAHASNQPKLLAQTIRFGSWQLPINYKETSTGGSCQPGCHKAYRYDRDKPVTNIAVKQAPQPSPKSPEVKAESTPSH